MITWFQSVRRNQIITRLMKCKKCRAVSTANTFTDGWMKIQMIKERFMKVLRMTKKGYHAESNPELDQIVTKWHETFEATKVARKAFYIAEKKLELANKEFTVVDKEWQAYEKKNGAPK